MRLPKDELPLVVVQPKPLALTNRVGDKNDFFINTPRKTIYEMVESNQGGNITLALENSIISDAPEGSLMVSGGSSQEAEGSTLTPAKRLPSTMLDVDEEYDESSVTKKACSVRIKK
ncbi:unnamed protein product [Eruca vesicaria subsp. sativa]|uniref:Uncharacterized protein n=1 Tax=Eruca vesicaria subsp. sativa TaxID=29727 RepID=A0ABC8LWJ8_ERUVS|nr:unnamed protein product [Eruca vesicaria subsp. sativa]